VSYSSNGKPGPVGWFAVSSAPHSMRAFDTRRATWQQWRRRVWLPASILLGVFEPAKARELAGRELAPELAPDAERHPGKEGERPGRHLLKKGRKGLA
jgi:hypothetical protein